MRLLLALLLALLFLGCAGRPADLEIALQSRLDALAASAPVWIHHPHSEKTLGSSGAALPMRAGILFQQIEAHARAKERLMQSVSSLTQQVVSGLYGAMNTELDGEGRRTAGLMSASQAITHAKRTNLWWAPSGELYLHLSLDRAQAELIAIENIRLFVRSNAAHEKAFIQASGQELLALMAKEAFANQIEEQSLHEKTRQNPKGG